MINIEIDIRQHHILIFSLLVLITGLRGQKKQVPMMSSTKEGVHIIIRGRYPGYSGFKVYRKETGFGKQYTLLTEEPIREIDDIYRAQNILGANWDYLKNFLDTNEPEELLMRMKSPDVATILRYCGVPFARVLGRYYFDNTAKWGNRYVYKIVLLNRIGEELQAVEVKYKVEDELPEHSANITFEQYKKRIRLKWNAPKYKEKASDDFVGFNLYRNYKDKTERLNFLPVLRRENILWIDRTVEEERTYQYLIKPVDVIGREGKVSDKISVYVKDLIPPIVPQGLAAEKGYEKIYLEWDKGEAEDIVNYKIYRARSLNASYSNIGEVEGFTTEYTDSTIIGGRPYFYKIQAVDNVDNASPRSTAVYSVARDSSAPPPPGKLDYEISEDNKSVILNWQEPPAADLQGYYVYRGYRSKKSVKLTPNSITETEFIDNQEFNPGHTYYYYVSAIDLTFNQSEKSQVKIQIPDDRPPLPPKSCNRNLTEEGYVNIRWHPSMSLDVENYKIYRKQKQNKQLLQTCPGSVYSLLDSTLTKGKKYTYSVVAVDSFDNESEEIKSKPIVSRDILPPPGPESINIKVLDRGVEISWDCREAGDLKGYNIYRSNSKYGRMHKINSKPVTNKNYFDKKGKKGKYYKVTSFDSSQNETASKIYRAK